MPSGFHAQTQNVSIKYSCKALLWARRAHRWQVWRIIWFFINLHLFDLHLLKSNLYVMQLNTAGAQGRTVGLVVVFFLCVQAFCARFVFYFSMLKVFDPGKKHLQPESIIVLQLFQCVPAASHWNKKATGTSPGSFTSNGIMSIC